MNFTELLIFMIVVRPGVQGFLDKVRDQKMTRKRGYTMAIAFFTAFAFACIGYGLWNEPPNAYQVLGIRTSATRSQISKAFKKQSLQYHPDKNPTEYAKVMFEAVRASHDLLADATTRDIYNKFGEEIATNPQAGEFLRDAVQLSMHIVIFYLVSAVVVFVFTLGNDSGKARSWSFLALFIIFVMEVLLKLGNYRFLDDVLPSYTVYQQVDILHSFFHYMFHGIVILAKHLYVDVEGIKLELLQQILHTQQVLMDKMDEIEERTGGAVRTGPSHTIKDKLPPNVRDKKVKVLKQEHSGGMNWGSILFFAFMAWQFFSRS